MKRTKKQIKFILSLLTLTAAFLALGLPAPSRAAYSAPISWSPMTMLNVTFNTTTQKLDVVDESVKLGSGVYVVLALDTYSDPAVTTGSTAYGRPNDLATTFGSFDPAQPWTVLNNTAFSRRLGWNPGNTTLAADIQTAFGSGAGIWIERISQSAGLQSYKAVGKYGVNSNNTTTVDPAAGGYTPIFGTAGSSTKWQWDYLMDHNVYTVSSAYLVANQIYTANYRVYVGDALGNDLASSASSLETWTWQAPSVVPEPATLSLLLGAGISLFFRWRKNQAA
jgi:hypothetical protein